MTPTQLFENAMDWLRQHYGEFRFFTQRDVEWTLQTRIMQMTQEANLPYRVSHNHTLAKGKRTNLAILNPDSEVEVAVELQYEPSHARSVQRGGDIWPSKLDPSVVFWTGDGSVAKDVQRVRQYVEEGKASAAYSVFIDEGGEFSHRSPHPGSEWRDWGEGRWVLWSKALRADGEALKRVSAEPTGEMLDAPLRTTQENGTTANWIPLTQWELRTAGRQGPPPEAIRFPDGSTVKIHAWNAILFEVAAWLWSEGKLTGPVWSGPKLFIINTEPFHSSGQPFQNGKIIPRSPWFVERSTGGTTAYRNFPVTLLRECRVDPNSVWIRTR